MCGWVLRFTKSINIAIYFVMQWDVLMSPIQFSHNFIIPAHSWSLLILLYKYIVMQHYAVTLT